MMSTLTNKFDLPLPVCVAVANDSYDRGESDITVTELIKPPQIRWLEARHPTVEDVSDRLWAMHGTVVHGALERAAVGLPSFVIEQRFYNTFLVRGKAIKVGGKIDLYDPATLTLDDYKFTSVWGQDGKIEWEQQMNMLAYLVGVAGHEVETVRVVAMFRDWQMAKAKQGYADYPPNPIKIIPVRRWTEGETLAFFQQRLEEHYLVDGELPRECTSEERWATAPTFAVMKPGMKRAMRLFDTLEDAEKFRIEETTAKVKPQVVQRPIEYKRCQSYCRVCHVCPQLAREAAVLPF